MSGKATIMTGLVILLIVLSTMPEAAAEVATAGGTTPRESGTTHDQENESLKGLAPSGATTTDDIITWQVMPAAGTISSSADFRLRGAAGQTAVGMAFADDIGIEQGFWQSFGAVTCCMGALRGNADYDPEDQIDIADVVFLVEFMFHGGAAPACLYEADLDDDYVGEINIADLVRLVYYLFMDGPAPSACP